MGVTTLRLAAVVIILQEVVIILHLAAEIIQCREVTGTLTCLHDVIHQGTMTTSLLVDRRSTVVHHVVNMNHEDQLQENLVHQVDMKVLEVVEEGATRVPEAHSVIQNMADAAPCRQEEDQETTIAW